MKYTPKISIIIPVYNMEEFLDDCVNSVLKQTYTNLEILLVDDGSKDHSPQMCDQYAEKYPQIKVIHKENGGLISAWSEGVHCCTGEYLFFLDSDDWIDPETISDLASHLSGTGKEIICSNYIIEKKNQSIPVIQSMPPGIYDRPAIETQIFPRLLGKEFRSIHCSRCMKLFSKVLFTDNMQYCERKLSLGEDMNIVFATLLDAERIVIVEKGLYYHYRFVDASMVHKYSPRLYDNMQLLYRVLHGILCAKKENLPATIDWKSCLKQEYIFLIFQAIKNELRAPDSRYLNRLPMICSETNTILGDITADIHSKANILLYWILKKPRKIRMFIGRIIIKVFDTVS